MVGSYIMNTAKYSRADLLKALRNNKVVVTFTKVDGTKRDMLCTLRESLIPADKAPKNTKKIKENDSVIKVFALGEADGWRSFRVDSVTGMTVITE